MKRPSVYARAVALVLVVAVPPVVTLGVLLVERNQHALRVDADHAHLLLAELARVTVGLYLDEAEHSLDQIAKTIVKSSGREGSDAESLAALSALFAEANGVVSFVTMYDTEGLRRGTLRAQGMTGEGAEVLPAALRGQTSRLGPVVKGLVGLSVPTQQGYAYTTIELEPINVALRSLGLRPPLRAADAVNIINASGAVIAGAATGLPSPVTQALGGEPTFVTQPLSIATEFELNGEAMLGAVVTLPKVGWAIVVQQPRAQAYESIGELRVAVALAVFLAVVLATIATLFGVRWLTTPIVLLTRATQELAERRFSAVDPRVIARTDELGELGRSFGSMAKSLEVAEQKMLEETRMRFAFSRFLAPELVDRLVHAPDALKLGGERKQVTVMFADVVGFSKLTDAMPPETVVALLNELFTFATEIVHRRGGMIDKFIGDAVMAVWGVPEAKPDDTEQAVAAAEELRRWVETGNRRWRQKWGIEIALGIGIHSGSAVAGNIGSARRMDYTVIGEAVNMAARLEAAAEPGQILISDSTRQALTSQTTVDLRPVSAPLRFRGTTTEFFEVGP